MKTRTFEELLRVEFDDLPLSVQDVLIAKASGYYEGKGVDQAHVKLNAQRDALKEWREYQTIHKPAYLLNALLAASSYELLPPKFKENIKQAAWDALTLPEKYSEADQGYVYDLLNDRETGQSRIKGGWREADALFKKEGDALLERMNAPVAERKAPAAAPAAPAAPSEAKQPSHTVASLHDELKKIEAGIRRLYPITHAKHAEAEKLIQWLKTPSTERKPIEEMRKEYVALGAFTHSNLSGFTSFMGISRGKTDFEIEFNKVSSFLVSLDKAERDLTALLTSKGAKIEGNVAFEFKEEGKVFLRGKILDMAPGDDAGRVSELYWAKLVKEKGRNRERLDVSIGIDTLDRFTQGLPPSPKGPGRP